MLTRDVFKSYLRDMPSGHVFDLTYGHLAGLFPPGAADAGARQKLRILAQECGCDVAFNDAEGRAELTRRGG